MALYLFVVTRDGTRSEPDISLELPDMNAAWEEATEATGEIIKELDGSLEVGTEWSIQIQDADRKPLRTINLTSQAH
jgi:hypothetical protein